MRLFKRLKLALITAAVSVGAPVALSINVNDGVGVAEDITPQIQVYEVAVDDGVGLAEDVSVAIPSLEINVADAVGVTESITVAIPAVALEVNVSDAIGVEDSLLVPQWFNVSSTHLLAGGAGIGFCGDEPGGRIADALDGSGYWIHNVNHTHYFIIDLGTPTQITKVRGRSDLANDPTNVNIYVSNDTGDWGVATATGISTWQDTVSWVQVVSVGTGRYVKVEITSTEHVSDFIAWGKFTSPIPIFDILVEYPVSIELTLEVDVANGIGVADTATVSTTVTLSVSVSDDIGVAENTDSQISSYEVYVSDNAGVVDYGTIWSAFNVDVFDSVGIVDYSLPQITPYEVSVDDDIGVATATTPLFNFFIINVSDDVGVVTNTTTQVSSWVYSLAVYDGVGVDTYVLPQIGVLKISTYDGIGLVDWRLHNIPDAAPTTTVDLFRFPRIPSDTDEKLKQFLIDLESALRTVLTGDSYVGGTINADSSKIGDVANYIEVNSNGILIFHGRSGLIHGCLFGDHVAWTQANAVQNTWYPILDADIATGHMKGGVTQSSGKFTVENEGQYMISYHIVYESNAANKHIETGIEISDSGTPDLYGRDHSEVKFSNEEDHMIGSTVINVPAGGTLNIMIRTIDTGTPNLSVQNVNMEVLQIGGLG